MNKNNNILPDGWFHVGDIKQYRTLVESVPDNGNIIELGVWKGRSLCSISDIIIRKKLKVFAVDTFKGSINEPDEHKEANKIDVSILGGKKTFCYIAGGSFNYTVGIDLRGQVWVWGNNNIGQLGDNSVTSRRTPVSILGGKKTFCNITAGGSHTVGVDYLGQVWCWGNNGKGQLGDNSVTSRLTPVSILGGKKTFCKVTARESHTVGVDYLGQVWGWGYNKYGELGDNSITSRRTPVSILGGKKTFCKITTGQYHTIGVNYLGQVWSWGYNYYGQLGFYNPYTPVRVYNL